MHGNEKKLSQFFQYTGNNKANWLNLKYISDNDNDNEYLYLAKSTNFYIYKVF